MPLYDYRHNEPTDCPDFDAFQKMADEQLETCPHCGESIHRAITTANFKTVASSPDSGKITRDFHGVGRSDSDRQIFTSPFTGEDLDVTGSTRHMQNVVADHYRQNGQDVTPEDVEPMNK